MQTHIQIRDLGHTYASDSASPVEALRGVNLSIAPGEFVALVGANGSGKTTLARHLNALLLPTHGQVTVAGMDTRDPAARPAIRTQVAMVFQRPEDQIIATTVEDDVAFGPENLGLAGDEIARRVRHALETVDMWALRHRPPHLLSAGQQQRVAIAGALAMQPRCLVLDEATAMLDPAGRRAVLSLAQALHAQGVTIVLITHLMDKTTLADRIVALSGGQVAFDGPPQALFTDPDRLTALGLEPPPLVSLTAELSRRWPGFAPTAVTVDELATHLTPRLRDNGAWHTTVPDPSPARQTAPLVVVRDLRHIYLAGSPLAATALDGVNLDVYPGEVVALLGPTGSGKSTLLQHIAGLLRPTAGTVHLDGHEVHAPDTDRRWLRQQVGMLFQKPEEQLFETYIGDDVAFGPRQLGLDRAAVRERVRQAMDMVGLPFERFKDRFTQGLSGGEKRKAALAGVLALGPRLLLLDEPTAGLDPRSRRELLDTLRRLNAEGTTLVIATHTMEDVVALASRVVVLQNGRVAADDTPRQLFGQPGLLAAYGLDVPEITALMHRLHIAGVLTVQEAVTVLTGERR